MRYPAWILTWARMIMNAKKSGYFWKHRSSLTNSTMRLDIQRSSRIVTAQTTRRLLLTGSHKLALPRVVTQSNCSRIETQGKMLLIRGRNDPMISAGTWKLDERRTYGWQSRGIQSLKVCQRRSTIIHVLLKRGKSMCNATVIVMRTISIACLTHLGSLGHFRRLQRMAERDITSTGTDSSFPWSRMIGPQAKKSS